MVWTPGPDLEIGRLRLAGLLKYAQVMLVEAYGVALAPLGVDGRELAVLSLLAADGPSSQQEISRRLGIDRTTVVALVDSLAARDLLGRSPDPSDRRKHRVDVSASGRSVARDGGRAIDAVEQEFLSSLPPADGEALRSLLRDVVRSASERHAPS